MVLDHNALLSKRIPVGYTVEHLADRYGINAESAHHLMQKGARAADYYRAKNIHGHLKEALGLPGGLQHDAEPLSDEAIAHLEAFAQDLETKSTATLLNEAKGFNP